MKNTLFVLLTVAFSLNSYAKAEIIYSCKVNSETTQDGKTLEEKEFLLSNKRLSLVSFNSHRTILELIIDRSGHLKGFVNAQPNFILQGSVNDKMQFRSAFAKGDILCDQGTEKPVIYFSLIPSLKSGVLMVKPQQGGICYAGNIKQAQKDLIKEFSVTDAQVRQDHENTIIISREEKACLKGTGTSADDYECHQYGQKTFVYKIKNCDFEAPEHP